MRVTNRVEVEMCLGHKLKNHYKCNYCVDDGENKYCPSYRPIKVVRLEHFDIDVVEVSGRKG